METTPVTEEEVTDLTDKKTSFCEALKKYGSTGSDDDLNCRLNDTYVYLGGFVFT